MSKLVFMNIDSFFLLLYDYYYSFIILDICYFISFKFYLIKSSYSFQHLFKNIFRSLIFTWFLTLKN